MPLQSMTGFARVDGALDEFTWAWELRSVNGKGLDIRLRLPSGYETLEAKARKLLGGYFKRGSIYANFQVSKGTANAVPTINTAALEAAIAAAEVVRERVGGDLPTTAEFMLIKGVMEIEETGLSDEAREARDSAVLNNLQLATDALVKARSSEGAAVSTLLSDQMQRISRLREEIDGNSARSPEAIRKQLHEQISRILQNSDGFDEQRLHQEAALLAAKNDLQEELDRLKVHVASANELLQGKGPVGRKLDFLAQEFNRECNTICSKSNNAQVTSLGLDMKLIIDQFREQLQNLE